ncbi:hypothetical protein EVAR_74560_1 [Eumeta japonica]|uniref:Uncharacterized protein n=1 Tax=Eumeta variegata TaxID=151549 RepID=A0A4C1TEV0_EUMVA|nr:hypothetical protein EVAR_74560_1 [Eumeta japonica]
MCFDSTRLIERYHTSQVQTYDPKYRYKSKRRLLSRKRKRIKQSRKRSPPPSRDVTEAAAPRESASRNVTPPASTPPSEREQYAAASGHNGNYPRGGRRSRRNTQLPVFHFRRVCSPPALDSFR